MGLFDRLKSRREDQQGDSPDFNWWDKITPWKSWYERKMDESSGWWQDHTKTVGTHTNDQGEEVGGPPDVPELELPEDLNVDEIYTGDQFFSRGDIPDEYKRQVLIALGYDPDDPNSVAQAQADYAGIPVASGHFYTDEAGNTSFVFDRVETRGKQIVNATQSNEGLKEDFQSWLERMGWNLGSIDEQLEEVGGLQDALQGGSWEQDQDQAAEYAARTMGFGSDDERIAQMQNLWQGAMNGSLNEQQWRMVEQDAARMVEDTRDIVKTLGDTSTGRQLAVLSELTENVQDSKMKAQLQYITYNEAKSADQYWRMVEAQQSGQGQYLDSIYQNRMGALQAAATSISAVLQQNQQYLQTYASEKQNLNAYIQNVYQGVMVSIGLEQHLVESAYQKWSNSIAPIIFEYEQEVREYMMEYEQYTDEMQMILDSISLFTNTITGIIDAVIPG